MQLDEAWDRAEAPIWVPEVRVAAQERIFGALDRGARSTSKASTLPPPPQWPRESGRMETSSSTTQATPLSDGQNGQDVTITSHLVNNYTWKLTRSSCKSFRLLAYALWFWFQVSKLNGPAIGSGLWCSSLDLCNLCHYSCDLAQKPTSLIILDSSNLLCHFEPARTCYPILNLT